MPRVSILIVDDDELISKNTARILGKSGYETTTALCGEHALALLREREFDVVLLDMILPDTTGLKMVEEMNDRGHDSVIIIITAHGSIESAVDAIKKGAFHYASKPVDYDNLKLLIKQGLDKKQLLNENLRLSQALNEKTSISGIIGVSKPIKEVIEMIRLAANSESNVLILGETGTGKELVADAIHYNSARSRHPFKKINCAALTETLLESELFGHEAGAYTDAKTQQRGFFELASKGTLLLDEIGCMSPKTQSKFLRVIEERKIKRLGSEHDIRVDVRIIASTNETIEKSIHTGEFRNDLFYRLNVIKIVLPPLRQRKDDVLLLARHFAKKLSGGRDVALSPQVADAFVKYNWPGNVRELQNVIERAFIFQIDREITMDHIPADFAQAADNARDILSADKTIEQAKRDRVMEALKSANGNKTEAARILGVSRYFVIKYAGLD